MLKKQLKYALFLGIGCAGLISITGVGAGAIARQQAKKTDAMATNFIQQYPKTQKNDSASTLETLSAQLGLRLVSDLDDSSIPEIDPDQAEAFEAISKALKDYFEAQRGLADGEPSAPVPESLQAYLQANEETLEKIQVHLRSQPQPVWAFEAALYTDFEYARPSYLGLSDLHKLLLLKSIRHSQQSQTDEMVNAVEAARALNLAVAEKPELTSHLFSLILSRTETTTLRYLNGVPPELSGQLLAIDQQQRGIERLYFESWTGYKAIEKAMDIHLTENEFLLSDGMGVTEAVMLKPPFQETYFTLSNVDTVNQLNETYAQLEKTNLCKGLSVFEEDRIAWWNVLGQVAAPGFSRQWIKGGEQMLRAELTHQIVKAKAIAAEQGEWPETLPNLESQVCPGEKWVYEVSDEGEMSLSFSHDLAWLKDRESDLMNDSKLAYRAKL